MSTSNYWWLGVMQIGFYFAITVYIVPYNALLPELADGPEEKVTYSTWLSVGFVLGVIFASQIPLITDIYQEIFGIVSRNVAVQWSIGSLSVLAAIFMLIPVLVIDEQKHCLSQPITIPFTTSFRQTIRNKNFVFFVIAESLYFTSLTIIVSGLLYYLRVLLQLEESLGGLVMGTMVIVSLLFYPLIGKLAMRFGKKKLVLFSLIYLSITLLGVFFMGRLPIGPKTQIFGFAFLVSLPAAFLGILPYAIIAELAKEDSQATGQQKEAMYFAVRNLANKFGQTLGIMIFAILTIFGKDPGQDLGIRLSGLFGFILCALAALNFTRYKE